MRNNYHSDNQCYYTQKWNKGVCLQNIFDYSPFGAALDGRTMQRDGYRYGFNGMEKDDEIKGDGNSYDFGARMLDPRLGRWLSIDSKFKSFPEWTPYKFALDDPLNWIDVDGNEEFPTYADYKAWAKKNKTPVLSHKEMHTQGHWLKEDRQWYEGGMGGTGAKSSNLGTAVYYRMANYRNLLKCDASHYKTLDERELFYAWANDYMTRKGHEVKWMCAAANTVNTISWGLTWIAVALGDSDPDIQSFIKKGNKMILDDMISKIKELDEIGCTFGSKQSLMWDAQALADEQNLIQPLYDGLPASSKDIMQDNFEDFLGAEGSVLDKADRWVYGMTEMGYKGVTKDMMPEAGKSWKGVGLSVDKKMNVTKVK